MVAEPRDWVGTFAMGLSSIFSKDVVFVTSLLLAICKQALGRCVRDVRSASTAVKLR